MAKRKLIAKVSMVKELAAAAKIPQVQAGFIYDVFMDIILKKVKEGYDVLLPNVGCIALVNSMDKRSNLTGQHIPPHKRIKFRANVKLARFVRVKTREYPIK